MQIRRAFLGSLALLGALASCADDDGPSPMAAEDFCDAYVDTFCEGLSSCCNGVSEVACREVERNYCQNALLTLDDRGLAPTGPNAPARIVFDFDEEGAGAAIARIKSAFSRCDGSPIATFADTHVLGEPGAECLSHQDCVESTRCEHPPLAVFGTCVLAPLEGQPCEDICAFSDLACAQDRGELVCVAPRAEGESCASVPCEEGLSCIQASSVIGGAGAMVCRESSAGGGGRDAFCDNLPGQYLPNNGLL